MKVRLTKSEDLEINLQTKEGFDELLKRVDSYAGYFSRKIFLEGKDKDDIKQDLLFELLRRIHKYDSEKGTIFAFMQRHFFNMTTNWIIRERKEKNTAADYKTTKKDKVMPLSLDADYDGGTLYNCIGTEKFTESVLFQKDLAKIVSVLSHNEKVAVLGIVNQQTMKEIAGLINRSPSRVNIMLKNLGKKRIVREALGKI